MDLIFFGTGAGKPSGKRNVTSMALNLTAEQEGVWLFDCGEATQHQMMHSAVTPHELRKIFITHLHGDHIFGLPGVITSRSMTEGASPLELYGPVGIKEYIETVLELSGSYMTYELKVFEIEEGVVFSNEQFTIKALELDHRVQSYGYRIEQANRAGRLDVEALKSAGVKPGPIFQEIKNGGVVELPDGQEINGADFVDDPIVGKIVTIFGDTGPCDNALTLAQGADLIVHEATLETSQQERANSRGHSTTVQAAQLAKDAGVKTLIITHISARYGSSDEGRLLQECRSIFPATKMAHDLESFTID